MNGQKETKAGHSIAEDSRLEVSARMPWVGRGGYKLAAALDRFAVNPSGLVGVDAGASTGGFTDVLLQRGAARIYAVDVGHGQLDWKLRSDPRVVVKEGINARYLRGEDIGEPVDLVVADLSFISLTLVLPALAPLLKPAGAMIVLVKPQFEAGRGQVGKGGIVRDPEVWRAACERVADAVSALGFKTDTMESPISGAEGNKEFLLYARH